MIYIEGAGMTDLAIHVREARGVWIVEPEGFINAHTVGQFEKTLEDLVENKRFIILLNCKGLNYISSAGLGAIMGLIEHVRNNQGDILLSDLQENVYSIFDTLGFTGLYRVFASEEEALSRIGIERSDNQLHGDRP